jgi:serine/threonine protein kinase
MPTPLQCPSCRERFPSPARPDPGGQVRCPWCRAVFAPAPPARPADLPATIDRYEVRSELGRGGFGVVYCVWDPKMERLAALKMLHADALESPDAVRRFLDEARVLAGLVHPNIVPIYDKGRAGPNYFLVSALITGTTLAKLIPPGGFPNPRRAVRLVIQLALALHHVFAREKILHRDVKPANIMIGDADALYLMDFGLAVCIEKSQERRTRQGAMLGTPAYMPPEQARGQISRIGPAADIYSAGVVLYQLLTGRLPFEGDTPALIHHALHTPPPPPSSRRPGLPADLEAICLKALEKEPENRYQTGEEFADVLMVWLELQQSESVPLMRVKPPAPASNPSVSLPAPLPAPAPAPPPSRRVPARQAPARASSAAANAPPRAPSPAATAQAGETLPVEPRTEPSPPGPAAPPAEPSPPARARRSWFLLVCLALGALILLAGVYFALNPGGKRDEPKKGERDKDLLKFDKDSK